MSAARFALRLTQLIKGMYLSEPAEMFYSERLMFRNWEPECDANTMLRLRNDASISKIGMATPRPFSNHKAKERAKDWAAWKDGLPFFAVCERPLLKPELSLGVNDNIFIRDDGKPRYPIIGMLNLFYPSFEFADRVAKVGIWFDYPYRGQGLAKEAVAWILKYAFDSLNLHKLEVDIHVDNGASRHVFTDAGFEVEGIRKSCFFWEGKWNDSVFMGLTEDKWRSINTAT